MSGAATLKISLEASCGRLFCFTGKLTDSDNLDESDNDDGNDDNEEMVGVEGKDAVSDESTTSKDKSKVKKKQRSKSALVRVVKQHLFNRAVS